MGMHGKLTSTFMKTVTEDGTYGDGGNLSLVVRYEGRSKYWQLRSKKGGSDKVMYIGQYHNRAIRLLPVRDFCSGAYTSDLLPANSRIPRPLRGC
jgi:hypothetical protein